MKFAALRRLAIASAVICLTLTTAAESPFDAFFAKFKTAVMSGDTNQLQGLMAQEFDYMGTTTSSPSQVFKGLSSGQWINLQSAVQAAEFVSQSYKGKPSQLLKCTPATSYNKCYIVFQTDSSGRWLWRAMVMPEK